VEKEQTPHHCTLYISLISKNVDNIIGRITAHNQNIKFFDALYSRTGLYLERYYSLLKISDTQSQKISKIDK
jgi:hypothetical protein